MEDLRKEFVTKQIVYEQQKRYRKTPEGKEALGRAKRRYNLKKKIEKVKKVGGKADPVCYCCNETSIGYLTVEDNCVICFNCKFGYPEEEIEELCQ